MVFQVFKINDILNVNGKTEDYQNDLNEETEYILIETKDNDLSQENGIINYLEES